MGRCRSPSSPTCGELRRIVSLMGRGTTCSGTSLLVPRGDSSGSMGVLMASGDSGRVNLRSFSFCSTDSSFVSNLARTIRGEDATSDGICRSRFNA